MLIIKLNIQKMLLRKLDKSFNFCDLWLRRDFIRGHGSMRFNCLVSFAEFESIQGISASTILKLGSSISLFESFLLLSRSLLLTWITFNLIPARIRKYVKMSAVKFQPFRLNLNSFPEHVWQFYIDPENFCLRKVLIFAERQTHFANTVTIC